MAQTTEFAPSSLVFEDPASDFRSQSSLVAGGESFSSSAALAGSSETLSTAGIRERTAAAAWGRARVEPDRIAPRPFSSVGIALTLGTEGVGLELASPLSARLNLRVKAAGAAYNPNLFEDGFAVLGDIRLLNFSAGLDIVPFFYKLHGLRITPGVTVYNGSRLRAIATVPGGQTFDLGYGTFTSDPNDPVRGNFNLDFGRHVAPRLTFGFGNISPRRGQRWSIPFEIGAEYIGRQPRITLDLGGSTCDATSCTPVNRDPEAQHDLAQEQINLNQNIPAALRFLPIVSIGIAYRFGH